MEPDETPRRGRPRPIAGLPLATLASRAPAIAKGWLLDLLDAAPLEAAADLPAAAFAAEAPRLCGAIVRALGSDADLDRLRPGGDLDGLAARAGRLGGAADAAEVAHAIEALRAVVWTAIRDVMSRGDGDLLADAAERLALVTSTVGAVSLAALVDQPVVRGDDPGGGRISASRSDAAIERAAPEPDRGFEPGGEDTEPPPGGRLWHTTVRHQLDAHRETGRPLALILVEVEGAARIRVSEPPTVAAAEFSAAADAVAQCARRGDVVSREGDARIWILAPGAEFTLAQAIAVDATAAVSSAAAIRGVPLRAVAGVAVYPHDGEGHAALATLAEDRALEALAAGVPVVEQSEAGPGVSFLRPV